MKLSDNKGPILLQKDSPLTEEINSFILLAHQMGLIDSNIQQSMPFVSKCAAWSDIQASHNTENTVQLILQDFYGILGFLAIGLVAGGIITILELFIGPSKKSRAMGLPSYSQAMSPMF